RTAPASMPAPLSPGLKAIDLLLFRPELAVLDGHDLHPILDNGGQYNDLLLELFELLQQNPTKSTSMLPLHSACAHLVNQLTQLMKNEKISPLEGVAQEFLFLVDKLLTDARKKQQKRRLIEQLAPRLRSGRTEP